MRTITTKRVVRIGLEECRRGYDRGGISVLVNEVNKQFLQAKVKFPLLEFIAEEIIEFLPDSKQVSFCHMIAELQTEGGNVLLGKILQIRLDRNLDESLELAAEFIEQGEEWFVTDIIAERVYGVGLLNHFRNTLAFLKKLRNHKSPWVERAIGPGSHYAIKKGLSASDTDKVFQLLLSLRDAKDPNVKTGIGWAAKTTAKFHPDIIEKYRDQIEDPKTGQWFRTKVEIGLKRNAYAKGN